MKYYFKRKIKEQGITRQELYSSASMIAAVVSLVYSFSDMSEKSHHQAVLLTGLLMLTTAICSAVELYHAIKKLDECNLYTLGRLVACLAMSIICFTCFDSILGL